MFHKIRKVETLENQIIKIEFENGKIKYYDMKKIIKSNDNFKTLKNDSIFNMAKVDVGGYGVIWNDELDISGEELYVNGEEYI